MRSVGPNFTIFKLTAFRALKFLIYLHIRPYSNQLSNNRLLRWFPGEAANNKHRKMALKQPPNPALLLQTASKSDSQDLMAQATLLIGYLNYAFPSSNQGNQMTCHLVYASILHMHTQKWVCEGLYLYSEPPGCLHSISQTKCTLVLL